MVDISVAEDWSPISFRQDFFKGLLTNEKIQKAFTGFRKAVGRKYPEYKYIVSREDWEYPLIEIFFLGGLQSDTYKIIPKENITWYENNDKTALYLKIFPGVDKQQIIDFLNRQENKIEIKFKALGIVLPKVKSRTNKAPVYELDLWVRVLNTFKTEEIRKVFIEKYPLEYKKHFMHEKGGDRKDVYRSKYELISHYVFHRFKLSGKNGSKYKADYIKSIVEKAKKNKTQIKSGLFTKIP